MNITALIVDDEPAARELLRHHLARHKYVEIIGEAANVDEAWNLIVLEQPQVVFLDMDLPGRNGLHLAERINQSGFRPYIICVTAYPQYAIGALRSEVLDYLLKPIVADEFDAALHRLVRRGSAPPDPANAGSPGISPPNPGKIRFNIRSGAIFIDPEEIVCCRADGNYTHIVIDKGREEIVSQNLKHIESLVAGAGLKRLGRSLLYNPRYLARVDRSRHELHFEKHGRAMALSIPPRLTGLF